MPAADRQLADATARAKQTAAERDELRAALDAVTKALSPSREGAGTRRPGRRRRRPRPAARRARRRAANRAGRARGRPESPPHEGARGDRLLNSRSFLASVADLDVERVRRQAHRRDGELEQRQPQPVLRQRTADLTGSYKQSQEVSMLALHLLQPALVYVDTLLQDILSEE
ncbi:hypothetical protein [Streptomyces flavidovirens]